MRTSRTKRWLRLAFWLALVAACRPSAPEPTTAPPRDMKCENSEPIVLAGKDTGVERCSNGMRHRPRAVKCQSFLPRLDDGVSYLRRHVSHYDELLRDLAKVSSCLRDSDCSGRAHGHCEPMRASVMTFCAYGCVTDSECSANELCLCGDPVGHCVPASCRTDADCAPPFVCGDYEPIDSECGNRDAFACQTERDECTVFCRPPRLFCAFSEGRRACSDECGIS